MEALEKERVNGVERSFGEPEGSGVWRAVTAERYLSRIGLGHCNTLYIIVFPHYPTSCTVSKMIYTLTYLSLNDYCKH